ncbi:multidrug transporter [Salmonella enterica subsp. enterica serovar Choleraesuis]|nr:multidrug transporter [Salmonella enterica subsp. enterica serovar Choleraesuis]
MKPYIYLAMAIVVETAATSILNLSNGFKNLVPTFISLACYSLSFFLLSKILTAMPVGIVYALWSGCGILLVTLVGFFFYHQRIDLPAILGILLILAGVAIINLFSGTLVK